MKRSDMIELLSMRWDVYSALGPFNEKEPEEECRSRFFWFLVGMGSLRDVDRPLFDSVLTEILGVLDGE